MAKSNKSYVIVGSQGGPTVDGTEEVILANDDQGLPSKVIGIDRPCVLTKDDLETLSGLGIDVEESEISADEVKIAPQAGSDTAGAGPSISS